jgi:hypothetical protein
MQPELNALVVAARGKTSTLSCRFRVVRFAPQFAHAPDRLLDVGNPEVDDDIRGVVSIVKPAPYPAGLDPGVLAGHWHERPTEKLSVEQLRPSCVRNSNFKMRWVACKGMLLPCRRRRV